MKINKNLMSINHTAMKRTKADIDYIVVHYVGALGDAKANTDYYKSVDVGASADFWVGHKGDIWQGNDYYNYYSWHCGGGYQSSWTQNGGGSFFGLCKNSNSIGIEMCVKKVSTKTMNATDTDWYFEDATVEATAELVAHLMKELDIGIDHVITHYLVNRKICPNPFVIDNQKWINFKNKVMQYYNGSAMSDAFDEAAASISWYRVRKTWADEKSQLGAYADLGNARKNCPAGYKVFDSKGNVVYEHAGEKDPNEAVANPAGIPKSKEAYIEAVGKICHDIMEETGVLASVVAAQCCLETGFGLDKDCEVLMKVNNLLGMKADLINNTWKDYTTWDGTTITKKTPEYRNGKLTYINDKFRAYADYQECIYDYVMFLLHVQNGKGYKYRRLKGVTDPAKVIHIIRIGTGTSENPEGYCTDPNYESKILKLIKDYNLDRFNVATITGDQVDGKERSEMAVKEIEYYRVAKDYKDGKYISQMGAYISKESAIKACESVGSGFKVYDPNGKVVYPVSTAQYRVQAGIFKSKENAEKLVAEMKKAGFDALITEEKE